jgi:hypothetical protein
MAKNTAILNEFLASRMEINCCPGSHLSKEIAALRAVKRKSLISSPNQWEVPV